jgi:hypothetical protein
VHTFQFLSPSYQFHGTGAKHFFLLFLLADFTARSSVKVQTECLLTLFTHFFSPALGGGCMLSWPARRTRVSVISYASLGVSSRPFGSATALQRESILVLSLCSKPRVLQNRETHEHGEVLFMPLLDVLEPGPHHADQSQNK